MLHTDIKDNVPQMQQNFQAVNPLQRFGYREVKPANP